MATDFAVSALSCKRAELAGEIIARGAALDQLRADLASQPDRERAPFGAPSRKGNGKAKVRLASRLYMWLRISAKKGRPVARPSRAAG